ncbi:hypothetical protein BDU57DRAFT_490162 [Ampelomyces quisqualis]|uniref:Ubiquitin-like protease family profile domain-containing protein n=1 Tax=Ampelomyces quisqualis TaxID=50730 RepID=A0A6A5QS95_AMPQU|nr:hypothetical protein BDU57DRAFT_490162 [Ampelomyces quisqualis]
MSILSQLWNAFTGDSEEKANVTDHVPLPDALPAYPFLPTSPTSPRHRQSIPIDLTSPVTQTRPSESPRPRAHDGRQRLAVKAKQSADEKRLIGDYDKPADAVYAPDPRSYFQSPHLAMVKPGSGNAFQPIDTLHGPRRVPNPRKAVTYSVKKSLSKPSTGQQAFWDQYAGKIPDTLNSRVSLRPEQAPRTLPPTKRRKTEHSSSKTVIHLSDDDEVQEIKSPSTTAALGLQEHGRPQSAHSSRFRRSTGSENASKGEQPGLQSANEFKSTENRIKAGCGAKKAFAKKNIVGIHGQNAPRGSSSDSNTPRLKDTTVYPLEDKPSTTGYIARTKILQSLDQGVPDTAPPPRKTERIQSHYFSNASINESTADIAQQAKNKGHSSRDREDKQLRDFRRADVVAHDDPISDNEVRVDVPPSSAVVPKCRRSASNSAQLPNNGEKPNTGTKKSSQIWSLNFARSHNFDSREMSEPTNSECSLQLRSEGAGKIWHIVSHDAQQKYAIELTVKAEQVITALADDAGRIRLQGSRGADGNQYMVDLLFSNVESFREVRDEHVPYLLAGKRPTMKEDVYLETLFSNPLLRNDKVGASPLVNNAISAAHQPRTTRTYNRSALRDQMKAAPGSSSAMLEDSGATVPSTTFGAIRASTRPARSTRATASIFDVETAPVPQEVEKFSIDKGLGPPWLRPLTYGEGRLRATVDFTDLWRLDEEELMNDSLIDFYMIYLFKQSKIPDNKVFFFNTFFFTKLTQNTGRESINYEAVMRWTSKLEPGIFGYDYIVIPINEDTHWYLAVICNVKNIPREAIQEDFDEGLAQEPANDSSVLNEQVESLEAILPEKPQLVDASMNFALPQQATVEQDKAVVNLVEEDVKLELIDRDDMGTDLQERPAGSEDPSMTHPPHDSATQTTGSIFNETNFPRTHSSNLHASPQKMKSKRRSLGIKKDPNQPVIIILDSLGHTRSPTVRALKDWVAAEGKAKRAIKAVIKEKGFYPKSNQIPTQANYTDCGVYLLGYAEKFFQDPDEFKRKLLTGEMTADDWPELKPKDMRNSLRDIIFALAKEQKLTEDKKKKKKTKTVVAPGHPSPAEPRTTAPLPRPPALQQNRPQAVMPDVEKQASIDTVPAQSVHESLANEQQNVPTMARLGSPFSPQQGNQSFACATKRYGMSTAVLAESEATISPVKLSSGSPRTSSALTRRTHPEVRIFRQPSPLKQPQSHVQVRAGSPRTEELSQQSASTSRSVSSLKRSRQTVDEDDAETPSKRSTSPKRRPVSRMSPSIRVPQEGHAKHHIEILDSQESKVAATQSPQRLNLLHPIPRKSLSRSLGKMQTLHHAASFEEIAALPPHTKHTKRRQDQEDFVGDQLQAHLDADDAQRRQSVPARRIECPSRTEEAEVDVMEVDSQGVDPMDTAEEVISETPSPQRSSPPPLTIDVAEF